MAGVTQNPLVYVIVLNYNRWNDTIECLESLLRLHYDNYRLVVVDNASSDRSPEMIRLWAEGRLDIWRPTEASLRRLSFPPVSKPLLLTENDRATVEAGGSKADEEDEHHRTSLILIHSGANLGFAGGNNVGIKYALADPLCRFVWLVNNDTVVDPSALVKMVERVRQKPQAGLCGSTLLYYHAPGSVQARSGAAYNRWLAIPHHIDGGGRSDSHLSPEDVEKKLAYIIGASVLASREFLLQVGLMREDYFFYFDEIDWSRRGRKRFALAYAPESIVYHKEGATAGLDHQSSYKSRLADYYWTRNRLRFTRRFYPYALPTVYLSLGGAVINRLVRRQWERAWMVIKIALGL